MKIDKPKLESAYITKINQICEDCEDKSHFGIPEIIDIIAELMETGEFILPPKNSSVLEICATRKKLLPQWNKETDDFVDELYSRLEWVETEVGVFNLRLKKQWTKGSSLYSQKEVDKMLGDEYQMAVFNASHED